MISFFKKFDAPCKLEAIQQASVLCAGTAKSQPMMSVCCFSRRTVSGNIDDERQRKDMLPPNLSRRLHKDSSPSFTTEHFPLQPHTVHLG